LSRNAARVAQGGTLIEPTDADLVRAARSDPGAFAALYRRYVAAVYRYARVRVGSSEAAEDITSCVFLDALAGLPKYRESGQFPGWLFTIARRNVQDYYRQLAREERRSGTPSEATPGREPDPVAVAELEAVRQALGRLSPDRREALELRFFAGLDGRAMAHVMNRKESAVKMLIHRGLGQLRQLLADAAEATPR
jgi:RNA polymerase sigma factor (sigma-70 family)